MIVKFKDLFNNDVCLEIECKKENIIGNNLELFLKSLKPIEISMMFYREGQTYSICTKKVYKIIKYDEYYISFSDKQLNYLMDTYHHVSLDFDNTVFNIIIKNLNAKRKKLHLKKEIPFDRYYEVIY